VHGEGYAKIAIHLRHQQRMRGDSLGAVEGSEPLECQLVVGISRSDGYFGREHVVKDGLRRCV
jgi:hypothetical protein